MSKQCIRKKIMELSIQRWNKTFGGISALDICDSVSESNENIMREMEKLRDEGKGSINANVELYPIKIDLDNPKFEIPKESAATHIFFPSKELLEEHFYSSNLVRKRYPEYRNRLHCGANQLALVMFSEEVLARYFNHPELYDVDDSLSGGRISSKPEASESRHLYVRHGKSRLEGGGTAITAIYKDLYAMSPEEQRHWHAHELGGVNVSSNDSNFARFLSRTYDGAFVDYKNPLRNVLEKISALNEIFGEEPFYKRFQNDHFRIPVENTRKSCYDCCSELYKLVGPDNINQNIIKRTLKEQFSTQEKELIHLESGRALSTLQLLELLEAKMDISGMLSKQIRAIGNDRMKAGHKIIQSAVEESDFVEKFVAVCEAYVDAITGFEIRFKELDIT